MPSIGTKVRGYLDFLTHNCKTEVVFCLLSVVFLTLSLGLFVQTRVLNAGENKFVIKKGSGNETKNILFVDVAGAVQNPGAYQLKEGSRVKDALIAANGISAQADREFVARNVNIASPLTDGQKIFIPMLVEGGELQVSGENSVLGETNSIININLATSSELDTLSGVGEKTAEKIIKGRPYGNIIELREKKVVGQAVYEKIKDYISTN